jgi:hypothetical protein
LTDSSRPPRVTVLMAVFNGEQYLDEAVESVLAQSYSDFEFLIVDDGSTDRTSDILRAFADPRIRVIVNERNMGLTRSLNRGLAEARGEFVARQDADDVSAPTRIAEQVAFLDTHPEVVLLGTCYTKTAADGTPLGHRDLPINHVDILWHLRLYCPFVHSAALWRRHEVASAVGGYDERLSYSMDYDLWCRIAARFTVANLPRHLVSLRAHGESMTTTYGNRAREGLQMRTAYAAHLLGWPAANGAASEQRFELLYSCVFGTPRSHAAEELTSAAEEVMRFHRAFVAAEQIGANDARRQRHWLQQQLGRQMLRAARLSAAHGARGDSWRILRAAGRYSPGALLSRDAVRTGLALTVTALGWK